MGFSLGEQNEMDLEKITKCWGYPKTKKEQRVWYTCVNLLRKVVENEDLPYIWEAFLVQNDVSISEYEQWKQKFRGKQWFQNAITDIKMLFADNIVRNAKTLGAENMKYLLQRVLEANDDDTETIVREFIEVKNA